MRRAGLLWALGLAACGEMTRLEPGQPPLRGGGPVSTEGGGGGGGTRGTGPRRDPDPVPNVTPYAAEAQLRRIDRGSDALAAIPATGRASAGDIAQLRRDRQQAEALAASRPVSRPRLGGQDRSAPDFSMPPGVDPLQSAIWRAQNAESRALGRGPTFP
ncbi:hypothetical protein [Mangrovicoccus algicola]|uniref:DUF3035 domain-containing protein n=1 Tax=Mangrovicoccus algicola TaxID=2771008 RepID=A0A8J6Z0Q0_9RHOB|nr:hypothetical protein [Mangrovicoccus algicola]MBE3639458.1 hypothetical protein [Mangrovicoccus algicola]